MPLTSTSFGSQKTLRGKQFRDSGNLGRALTDIYSDIDAAFNTLEGRARSVSLTAGAESSDVIDVIVQVSDAAGNAVEEAVLCMCELYDASMLHALVGAFTLAESGDGAEVSTTARPAMLIRTSAAGVATLDVTDVATGSGATVYLKVTPITEDGGVSIDYGTGAIVALTFD